MTELQQKYLEISKDIISVLNDMKSNWDRYPDYLGWFDLNGPIIEHPDILFIGINQGPGRYLQWNWDNWDERQKMLIDPAKNKLPDDFPTLWRSRLQWLMPNNARENGEWWEENKTKKNFFPYYMCELLVKIYRREYPNESRENLTNIFEQRVMATNLYPMSTFDTNALHRLLDSYYKTTGVDLKKLCSDRVVELIKMVKPHCVILLGDSIKDEFAKEYSDYCISRKHGWHGKENIRNLANDIYHLMNS
jgi:hypothetical protein